MVAAETTAPSPTKTCSPTCMGKKAIPLLNCLYGGRMTEFLPITQYLPVRTLARSPRMMAPLCTITLPFKIMFWEPQSTVWRLTLLPEACKQSVFWS